MDETVVSFYHQGYGLLLLSYTCSNFFQFHATNIMGSLSLVKELPYLKGTGRVAVFFLSSFWLKLKQKRLHMRLRRKLNVYVFVTTTISNRMNGNLREPTCKCTQTSKASDQINISKGYERRERSLSIPYSI